MYGTGGCSSKSRILTHDFGYNNDNREDERYHAILRSRAYRYKSSHRVDDHFTSIINHMASLAVLCEALFGAWFNYHSSFLKRLMAKSEGTRSFASQCCEAFDSHQRGNHDHSQLFLLRALLLPRTT